MITLTPRETQVARGVARGLRNKEIGTELNLTENTVKAYIARVFGKLGIKSRLQLALMIGGAK